MSTRIPQINPITFDATELFSADGTIVFRFTRGMPGEPPMVRGEDDTVASRPGRVPYPRVSDVLPIGLEGRIQAPGERATPSARAWVETTRRALLSLFTPSEPRVLSVLLPDGATATINADVVPLVLVKDVIPDAPGLVYDFDVALESVDPEWVITPVGSGD